MSLGVLPRGNMTLAPRYNAKTHSMFISALQMKFYPNFSIINQLLTYLRCKIGAYGYMTLGGHIKP